MLFDVKGMSDADLAAAQAVIREERERREAIPPEQRPNPRAVEIAKKRHENLFGKGA